jgi:hypothetical protein
LTRSPFLLFCLFGFLLVGASLVAAFEYVQNAQLSAENRHLKELKEVTVYVTESGTQQMTVSTTQPTKSAYALIKYRGQAWAPSGCPPLQGTSYLGVETTVENHGYDRLFIQPSDLYVVFRSPSSSVGQQFQYSSTAFSCYAGKAYELQATYVLNGLSVEGVVFYEVPDKWAYGDNGPFKLLWNHPSDVNVQYVPLPS